MKLLSENIVDYIDLNYDIDSFSDIKELEKVEELVINRYNYSLEEAVYYPEELAYFKNLKKCTFLNFTITDEIVDILDKLSLEEIVLDHCQCLINHVLHVEKLLVEGSPVSFMNTVFHQLVVVENKEIDIQDICHSDIQQLTLLNTPIIHSSLLKKLPNCKIKIQGCSLDDSSVKELENVTYDANRYFKIG